MLYVVQSKGSIMDLDIQFFRRPQVALGALVAHVLPVIRHLEVGMAMPECAREAYVRELSDLCTGPKFGFCPFSWLHRESEEVEVIDDPGMLAAAQAYTDIGREIKGLEEQKRLCSEVIKQALGDRKKVKFSSGHTAMMVTTKRIKTERIKRDHPELWADPQYLGESSFMRVDSPRGSGK
jgi:hypothetical protein